MQYKDSEWRDGEQVYYRSDLKTWRKGVLFNSVAMNSAHMNVGFKDIVGYRMVQDEADDSLYHVPCDTDHLMARGRDVRTAVHNCTIGAKVRRDAWSEDFYIRMATADEFDYLKQHTPLSFINFDNNRDGQTVIVMLMQGVMAVWSPSQLDLKAEDWTVCDHRDPISYHDSTHMTSIIIGIKKDFLYATVPMMQWLTRLGAVNIVNPKLFSYITCSVEKRHIEQIQQSPGVVYVKTMQEFSIPRGV